MQADIYMKSCIQTDSQGFAALFTVVIVSAAALTMALTASFIGFGELDSGYTNDKANETLSLADGCMEEALTRLRTESGYLGEMLALGNGNCTITVVTLSGVSTISVVAQTTGGYSKNLEAVVSKIGRTLSVISWNEI
jgi:uncharacterized protein YdiU (UPF0061 family)